MGNYVVGIAIFGLIFYIISIFNRLVYTKNRYVNAFSQIDVQLKRRYDLIPNLVEVAKHYMEHEKSTLERVIAARNNASVHLNEAQKNPSDSTAIRHISEAENKLRGAISNFNMVMESYPQIKADTAMQNLQEELSTTENKIAFARQFYNDSVMEYNIYRQSFPQTLFASLFGHTSDATMIEFNDAKEIQNSPKMAF
ncbi:MAG: LemA family protein [Sulfuricurvum sp.]|uniref:LemA family protein n=1 Tax=Sulfuricurvum sp. TaxID=2025608 RepID=UPI002615FE73|nr:LemA family protein [Sulfuricurvum sp.]MDD2830249.1 LemA family protein [Sulfuricurvum sp.]MDD4948781.1 LemA family protein [Sulfuricurvum sp.]